MDTREAFHAFRKQRKENHPVRYYLTNVLSVAALIFGIALLIYVLFVEMHFPTSLHKPLTLSLLTLYIILTSIPTAENLYFIFVRFKRYREEEGI